MPDSKKLFAVLLGGRAEGCNIELHDVQFTVADRIEDAFADLRKKWFGLKTKVHLDSYMPLDVIDGFKISLKKEDSKQQEKLFFINLGAYEDGLFTELHATKFLVDSSESNAKERAKALLLKGKKSVHTDDLYDVDDCLTLTKVNGMHVHLTPTSERENLIPINGYRPF